MDAAAGLPIMSQVDVTGRPGCRYGSRMDAANNVQFYYIPETWHSIRSLLTLSHKTITNPCLP
jgi:hypothetical protein